MKYRFKRFPEANYSVACFFVVAEGSTVPYIIVI